jgi:uncharacterized coiled-coil DUF342 family protein
MLRIAVKRQKELSAKDSQTIQQLEAKLRELQQLSPEVNSLLAELARLSNFTPPNPMPISAVNAYLTKFVAHLTQHNAANLEATRKLQEENKQFVRLVKHQKEEMERYARTIQQGISEVAKTARFSEAFSDPADSYFSRFSEYLNTVNQTAFRLRKVFGTIREEKMKLESDLASITAERDALHAKLDTLGALMAELKAKHDADDDRSRREQSEVFGRLRSLLPGLSDSASDDPSFRVQADRFIIDFTRVFSSEVTRHFEGPMSAVYSGTQTLVARIIALQARLSGLIDCYGKLRQQHDKVVQASRRRDDSYKDTLAMLFGEPQPDLENARAVHEQVVKTQMILKSVFRLIPDLQLAPPDNVYLLALALRRQLESPSIITSQEQLVRELQSGEISAVDEHNSLIGGLVNQVRKAVLLLRKSVMLRSVVPPLAEALGTAAPRQTSEELTRLIEEVKVRVKAGELLRQKITEFHARIKTLTDGLEVSLPESVTGVISALRTE